MFSDTKFWRLIWKEYRTQRPLWLTLLIGTQLLQVAFLALSWGWDGTPLQLNDGLKFGLLGIPYAGSAIYVLGCCATLFSVEHEMGTFDFQRVLPANQPRVFWAKVGFAFVSSMALTLLLWLITRGVFVLTLPREGTAFGGFGLLFLVELFLWSILCSLLIRQPLWGVVTSIAAQSVMLYLVVAFANVAMRHFGLPEPSAALVVLPQIGVILALCVLDIVLGKLWFDDRLRLPRWGFRLKPDTAPGYSSGAELPPYLGQRQIGWSRLLWLGWRDGRWVQGATLAWFGFQFLTLKTANFWHELLLPGLAGSFVCGLFAFAPEQWSSRFRFMAERGCSPRSAWLSRQAIWLPPVLLMTVATLWLQSDNHALQYPPHLSPADAAFSRMYAALCPLLYYSAGQFAAMMFRSTAIAIAVALALTFLGFMWGQLMTSWLAPTWWSVGSLPVIGLFVTWLKANDWIEERRDRVARWRLALGLGIPISLLLVTCATYRVVQIPVVQLPADWSQVDDAESNLSPAEKETLELYRRAYAEQLRAAQKHFANTETRLREIQLAHPEWDELRRRNEDEKVFREQWRLEMVPVVDLLAEAHSRPAVALEFLNSELPRVPVNTLPSDAWSDFSAVLVEHARHHVNEGNLDEAWQGFEMEWELLRRAQLRVTADSVDPVASYEERVREEIVKWGRHPHQSRDRILKAIRRLETVAQQDVVRNEIHRQFVTSWALVEDFERWHRYVIWWSRSRIEYGAEMSWWIHWRMQPWERWRFERLLRRHAFFAVSNVDGLKRQLETHLPLALNALSDVSIGPETHERTLIEDTTLPPNMRGGFQIVVFNQFAKRAEAFRATILRLALADWNREHGRYPESLSELVPTYFAEVPLDPASAAEIVYFPNGVDFDITPRVTPRGDVQAIVPKGIPFFVTSNGTGTRLRRRERDGNWVLLAPDGNAATIEGALVTAAGLATARFWPLEPEASKRQP